jgi:hypothetical protein
MIIDSNNVFSDAQSLVANNATDIASTNLINWGAADPNLGGGTPVWLNVSASAAIVSGANTGSLTVELQDCATDGGTYAVLVASKDWTTLELETGAAGLQLLMVPIPRDHKQFMRVKYIKTGQVCDTTGTVEAYLTSGAPRL